MLNVEISNIPPLGKVKSKNVVKSLLYIMLMLIFVGNEVFAQTYHLSVKSDDGSYLLGNTKVSDISKVVFVDCPATVDDADGNTYNTVVVGEQCWMKENLNIGTKIVGTSNQINNDGTNSIIEKYCYLDSESNCATYGGLYQWGEAVAYKDGASNTTSPSPAFSGNIQGICPTG